MSNNHPFKPGDLVRMTINTGKNFVITAYGVVQSFSIGIVIGNEEPFEYIHRVLLPDGNIHVVPAVSLELL